MGKYNKYNELALNGNIGTTLQENCLHKCKSVLLVAYGC